jgi:hypothetical protein
MGYRSDLVVLIYPDVENAKDMAPKYEQLKLLMGTTFKEVVDEFFGSCMEWLDSDYVLKFDINDVKWYPSYSDVQMFEKMLSTLKGYDDEDIKGYCTEFVRIGEESDDTEEVHTGDNNNYYLQVRRTIDCNV